MRRAVLVVAVCALGAAAAPAAASIPPPGVPNANHRVGHPANKIAPGFTLTKIAQGSDPLENPSGLITTFGFLNDASTQPVEATKTEPDQNTYLVFKHGLPGPTHGYDYGTHFLFQPHELFDTPFRISSAESIVNCEYTATCTHRFIRTRFKGPETPEARRWNAR